MDTAYKIKVMHAFINGQPVEYCAKDDNWQLLPAEPTWDWTTNDYRIKQVFKRPLAAADFPPGTVIREIFTPASWRLVNMVKTTSFYAFPWRESQLFNSEILMNRYEYSTDQGKTWRPCYHETH